ncbi:hypothetical protein BDR22DRAFT_282911 [Usnea florida]
MKIIPTVVHIVSLTCSLQSTIADYILTLEIYYCSVSQRIQGHGHGFKRNTLVFTLGLSVCSSILLTIGNLLDDRLGRFRKVKGLFAPLASVGETRSQGNISFSTLLYNSSNAWTLGSERFSNIAQPSSPDLKRKTPTP